MHLVFGTRGIKHCVDIWKAHMQSQYFPYVRKGSSFVQGALQPMQFWSYVFPKESFNDVMWNLGLTGKYNLPKSMIYGVLRKSLNLKKIPELQLNQEDLKKIPNRFIYKDTVSIYPIGIKEDADGEDKAENL